MSKKLFSYLEQQIKDIRDAGLYKAERIITSPQSANIKVQGDKSVLNFCANNYLGLADHPKLIEAAHKALDNYGYGMASVRFICGTLDVHKNLEKRISKFLNTQDTILYPSGFDANAGLFETILSKEDAIISDELNHASIIDGVRLCKASRYRYKNSDMDDLERCLKEADSNDARHKLIATDGVFSMDGYLAKLPEICDLADKYDALVMVDECHASGFIGEKGQGTPEFFGVQDRIDIVTGTLGKALGGASGGFTSGKKQIVEMLRQKSRTYLFSNTIAPVIAATSLTALDMLETDEGQRLRSQLQENKDLFRSEMTKAGFDLLPGDHAIIPVMLYDAALASEFADKMLERGVYVVAFSYPVVPKGKARIRTQMSAAHTSDDINQAVDAFIEIGKELGVLKGAAA